MASSYPRSAGYGNGDDPWDKDKFLATLRAAREVGLNVYGAVAPTSPECDEADLRATLRAVAEVEPVTIVHEPIRIRAENVGRIQSHAAELGVRLKTDVFETREQWQAYAVNALQTVERLADELGLADRLHLWPDKWLGHLGVTNRMPKPKEHLLWLRRGGESANGRDYPAPERLTGQVRPVESVGVAGDLHAHRACGRMSS